MISLEEFELLGSFKRVSFMLGRASNCFTRGDMSDLRSVFILRDRLGYILNMIPCKKHQILEKVRLAFA